MTKQGVIGKILTKDSFQLLDLAWEPKKNLFGCFVGGDKGFTPHQCRIHYEASRTEPHGSDLHLVLFCPNFFTKKQ